MASIRITEGAKVKVKGTGDEGTVLSTYAEKSGSKGRPKTYAQVILGSGSESTYSLPELRLV